MSNLLEILNKSVNYLKDKGVENSRLEVEKLLSEVLKIDRIMLYANFERKLDEKELERIRERLNSIIHRDEKTKVNHLSFVENEGKNNDNNLKYLLDKSINYLEKNSVDEGKLIAEIIFSHILKIDRMMLFTKYRENISEEQKEQIRRYVQRVGKDKFPVQYLLNEQQFYGRNFYVNKGVLIPRQDTEILVEETIKIIKNNKIRNPILLDMGTGSGVIGLTLALEIEDSKVMGVDISDNALEISNKNKEILGAKNIKFFKSNLFENIEYKNFDLVVSNPPYIDKNHIGLMSLDTIHEPEEALFAEDNGLFYYYEIGTKGYEYIKENGYLLFEIGYNQGNIVKDILLEIGYRNVEIISDLQGLDRVVIGQK